MVCRELSVELKLLMPKIKLFKDCLWRDGSHNINQAEVRARRNSNSIHGHLRREGSSSQARRKGTEHNCSTSSFRASTGRASIAAASTHRSRQRFFLSILVFEIFDSSRCFRCKDRRTRRTLTSILVTRSCLATKCRAGTKSSEDLRPALLNLSQSQSSLKHSGFVQISTAQWKAPVLWKRGYFQQISCRRDFLVRTSAFYIRGQLIYQLTSKRAHLIR